MSRPLFSAMIAVVAVLPLAAAHAQSWGGPGWGGPGWGGPGRGAEPYWAGGDSPRGSRAEDSREGRVDVDRFVAEGDGARALGHGAIAVTSRGDGPDPVDSRNRATYEAAIVDRLAAVGYDTAVQPGEGSQAIELRVVRAQVRPEEAKRSPVSGEMALGTSNRGSMMGMAINVDLSKPRKALYSTRIEARIRDRTSNAVLWEGHAEIVTRDGDDRWTDQAIATKLAGALFDGFPRAGAGV